MNMVHLKINGIDAEVPAGSTILEAAKSVQIEIPSLCYLKDINCIGACRVCVVEVKGARALQAACVHPVSEGMEVFTHTPKVMEARKVNLELILSVPLEVSVEIGRTTRRVEEILSFSKGTLVVLDKLAGDQVDIFVNGLCVAHGDVVVIDDNFGVRITDVVHQSNLLKPQNK